MNDDGPIFHLALPEDWAGAFATGSYRISTRGMSLDEVGFVHCSTREQTPATANRFYGDVDHLVLLTVDPARLDAEVKWEPPAPGSPERFPHVYGPIPIAAVHVATHLSRGDGPWVFDDTVWPD